MKRAAIIITDADYVFLTTAWGTRTTQEVSIDTSEQLLADLREAASACALVATTSSGPRVQHWNDLATRIREVIGGDS